MRRKQSRAKSFAYYLKETGLLNSIGEKRWNEFLDDVYNTLEKSLYRPIPKMIKSKSDGDLCIIGELKNDTESKIESKLVYNKEIGNVNDEGVRDENIRTENVGDENIRGGNVGDENIRDDMHKQNMLEQDTIEGINTFSVNQKIITQDTTKDHPLLNTSHSPQIEKRPDESYYNNGYVQSIGHSFIPLKHPPCPNLNTPYLFKPKINKKELDLRIQAVLGLLKLRNVKKD